MIKTHTAASGKRAGQQVRCTAKKMCRLGGDDEHMYFDSMEQAEEYNQLELARVHGSQAGDFSEKDKEKLEELTAISDQNRKKATFINYSQKELGEFAKNPDSNTEELHAVVSQGGARALEALSKREKAPSDVLIKAYEKVDDSSFAPNTKKRISKQLLDVEGFPYESVEGGLAHPKAYASIAGTDRVTDDVANRFLNGEFHRGTFLGTSDLLKKGTDNLSTETFNNLVQKTGVAHLGWSSRVLQDDRFDYKEGYKGMVAAELANAIEHEDKPERLEKAYENLEEIVSEKPLNPHDAYGFFSNHNLPSSVIDKAVKDERMVGEWGGAALAMNPNLTEPQREQLSKTSSTGKGMNKIMELEATGEMKKVFLSDYSDSSIFLEERGSYDFDPILVDEHGLTKEDLSNYVRFIQNNWSLWDIDYDPSDGTLSGNLD